jgi:hypothetical protein
MIHSCTSTVRLIAMAATHDMIQLFQLSTVNLKLSTFVVSSGKWETEANAENADFGGNHSFSRAECFTVYITIRKSYECLSEMTESPTHGSLPSVRIFQ